MAGQALDTTEKKALPRIEQTIVVEGKDDVSAVLAAVDANVLWTHGYGINQNTLDLIKAAYERTGIIIFTDPDHAGRQIRERLTKLYPDALQAYLTQDQAEKAGDIGIENAAPDAILSALTACGAHQGDGSSDASHQGDGSSDASGAVSMEDLFFLGLAGTDGSSQKRAAAGAVLGIGTANTKTFLKRLRHFGIGLEELKEAVDKTEK